MAVEALRDWRGKPVRKEKHGGLKAANFIYVLVSMTNMATIPNILNMVTYIHNVMYMGVAGASTTMTNFIGITCVFSLLGGFLSDSYITRFKTILIFAPFEVLGYGLLAIQAHFPSLRPPKCDLNSLGSNCRRVHGLDSVLLYIGLYTVALGEGCLRTALASFGGDQFDDDNPVETRQKSSFFNWYTFGISIGSFTGLILVVWVEANKGWDYGFAISGLIVLVGLVVFASGFTFYRNQRPSGSPFTRMMQVFVAAFKKRKLSLPENDQELHQEQMKGVGVAGEILPHTKSCIFLDKASIVHGKADSWSLCAVTQVEETKIVLKMVPIFICAVFSYTPIPLLLSLSIQQGSTMNNKLGSMRISTATLVAIPVILQMVILIAYERLFVPFARRLTGYKQGVTHLQRIGVGFVVAPIATVIAALMEVKRKNVAQQHGLLDSTTDLPMSVFWLVLQFMLLGVVDSTSFVGLLEFFSSEFSQGMKSLGTAVFWCILGLSSFLGTVLVEVVNRATRGNGKVGWLDGNNLNKNHLDRFYWLLSALGLTGFLTYLCFAKRYVYHKNPRDF